MRNASDIFCLNDSITDGTQMFSVNGSCPLRISRRRHTPENDCFEYGRSTTNLMKDNPIPEIPSIDDPVYATDEADERYSQRLESVRSSKGDVEDNPKYDEREIGECNEEDDSQSIASEVRASGSTSKNKSKTRKGSKVSQVMKIPNGKEESPTTTNMKRNPLTGDGIQLEEYRKPKKGPGNRKDKWLW